MQTAFTPEEQQLIDRLKVKYEELKENQGEEGENSCSQCNVGTSSIEVASQAQTLRPSVAVRASSDVEASICAHCHGSGTLVETYNHRRLESYCKECDGRGVRIFRNGVEVAQGGTASVGAPTSGTAPGAAGIVALHSRTTAPKPAGHGDGDGGSSSEGEASASGRVAVLQRDIGRIASKAAAYTKERLDAMAVLQQPPDTATDPAGRELAARQLVAQLDLQLERLELARRKKETTMERLRAGQGRAATLTMDDIIANESGRP